MSKTYGSPAAFKAGIETRLKTEAAKLGRSLERVRQLFIFDRFLARIVVEFADAIVLKGGLALELRLERARTTKDIDTRYTGDPDSLLPKLRHAGQLDLGDFMTFEVEVNEDHPEIEAEEAKYGGKRFRVSCKVAARAYGNGFPLDVGIGDPMTEMPEEMTMPDRVHFMGVAPARVRIYPIETHLAEKLHAYTKPRIFLNSRDKDLLDIALISALVIPSAVKLTAALQRTFAFRDTHIVPTVLPPPPAPWHGWYPQKQQDYGLEWPTLTHCYEQAIRFINPVLAGIQEESAWDPASGEWRPLQGTATGVPGVAT